MSPKNNFPANVVQVAISYYRIGGLNLVRKGLQTKLETKLSYNTSSDDFIRVSFNGKEYELSTEYPSAEMWARYERGVMEPGPKKILKKRLSTGDTFIDIGAQCGDTAFFVHSLVSDEGSIHAFEPTTYWYNILEKNISRNGTKNIHPNNRAVGAQQGTLPPDVIVGGRHDLMEDTFDQPAVEVTTIDDYTEEHNLDPDLIQIDVDGAEYEVLKGGNSVLNSTLTILELHSSEILDEWDETVDYLIEKYRVRYLDTQGFVPLQHPFKQPIDSKEQLDEKKVHYLLLNPK